MHTRHRIAIKLKEALENLGSKTSGWGNLLGRIERLPFAPTSGTTRLTECHDLGSNPGNLRMFRYAPRQLADDPALVVVLHGCTQTAAGYDLGAGWSTLADRYGFALLFPEQQRSNNPNGCFNWFQPEHSQRGKGEPLSIRQMIEKYAADLRIDRRRVFITGLSAGGAMTSVMLSCYPEVFAGGAIIAGLPYGSAANVQQAFQSMFQSPPRPARDWGDLVRKASSHQGPWPRVSVWHGDEDKTVVPSNAREILKQWADVHGLPLSPSGRTIVDGYPREVWMDEIGDEILESYTITNMAHGTPLAQGDAEGACGVAGPFLLPVGISSSYHISKFFRIAARQSTPAEREIPVPAENAPARQEESAGLSGEILGKETESGSTEHHNSSLPDIGGVINKALKAAGLIRN